MKKILTLLALLCMVCTGAWAEEITVTSVDQLQNGVKVTIKNVSKGQYVNLGNNNVAFSTTATVFTLKGDNTNGFKLYDATNSRYVGGTRGNGDQALTKTDANEAGLFTFASYSSYFSIHCENPEVNTKAPFDTNFEYWGLRNQTQTLVTWQLGTAARFEIKIQESEVSEQEIAALQEKINNVYSNVVAQSTVGYPSYKTNKATIDNAIQYSNNYTTPVSKANYDDAEAALNAVYALTDINLPEDGKAYTFTAVYQDGKKYYLNYATTGVTPVKREDSTLPASAQFVARKLDNGKFVFVSQDGKYLAWKGASAGTNSNKGYTDSWNETENSLTLQRIALNGSDTNNVTIEEFFGKLGVVGKRGDSDVYFLVDANNANSPVFNQDGRVYSRYTTRYSVAFQIEEVDNPNKVKLSTPNSTFEGGLNKKCVGTFSAPYNVELPEGVKAYTASQNGTRVTFTELGTGECRLVPKNTGVLVYAESENSVDKLAVPAAAAMPTMDGVTNLFEGTNGTSTTVEDDVNAYILGFKAEEGVKFYKLSATSRTIARNKAYLVMPNSAPVSAFYFDFEDTITGIESVDATSREAGAIYDLAGRNVKANQRGLYIVGGKKVIR